MFPSCSRIRQRARGRHPAVIVMPGGGYNHLVIEQEGAYEARWLAAHGVAAFVLEYRLAAGVHVPWPDAGRVAGHSPTCGRMRRNWA